MYFFCPSVVTRQEVTCTQLTCSGLLLSGSWWDPSQGQGEHAEASEVLGGVLDDPGVAPVHLEQGGGAVLDQPQRVPLAVGERSVPDRPLHLPHGSGVRDVVDVAVPELRGGGHRITLQPQSK